MAVLQIDEITIDVFKAISARYPNAAPSALGELDLQRYETVPAKLASMEGEKHLSKADVERLVEWKLKHGTFRPALMNLVKSNPADVIQSTTASAFSSLDSDKDVLKALKLLTVLRGIGPATASLLLSVYHPDAVPFFSDELFRWSHWDGVGPVSKGPKAGQGWDRKINYSVKEYGGVLERVERLRSRLKIGATEAEKVAYVLGRERVDVDRGVGVEEGDEQTASEESDGKGVEEETEKVEQRTGEIMKTIRQSEAEVKVVNQGRAGGVKASDSRAGDGTSKKSTKRKAQEQKIQAEAIRRRTRRKV
ncbi:DUF1479 domain protein [Stagonosporopsis vannaccii]|nr:DUF1479 domain protein [Stagonosporopsis vannaccii]